MKRIQTEGLEHELKNQEKEIACDEKQAIDAEEKAQVLVKELNAGGLEPEDESAKQVSTRRCSLLITSTHSCLCRTSSSD
jgi:hypothetical protein